MANAAGIFRFDLFANRQRCDYPLKNAQPAAGVLTRRQVEERACFGKAIHERGIDPRSQAGRRADGLRVRIELSEPFEQLLSVHRYRFSQSDLKRARARASMRSTAFSVFPVASAISRTLRFSQ